MTLRVFSIDNNQYCIGKLCLYNPSKNDYCEHVVLNHGVLEIWNIFKIRTELGHKIFETHPHFSTNKIRKSVSMPENILN